MPELTSRLTASRSSFFSLSLFAKIWSEACSLSFGFSLNQDLSLSAISLGIGFRERWAEIGGSRCEVVFGPVVGGAGSLDGFVVGVGYGGLMD